MASAVTPAETTNDASIRYTYNILSIIFNCLAPAANTENAVNRPGITEKYPAVDKSMPNPWRNMANMPDLEISEYISEFTHIKTARDTIKTTTS